MAESKKYYWLNSPVDCQTESVTEPQREEREKNDEQR